jgi:hypothetical protein
MLFRLAEYAGMPELGIDVILFMVGAEAHLPEELREALPAERSPNQFLGFSSDCAWFSVERRALATPRVLVSIMAHQVARAWRTRQGLSFDPSSATAEWDAVIAVLLGYGVITCNAAYEYDVRGEQRGLVAGHAGRTSAEVPCRWRTWLACSRAGPGSATCHQTKWPSTSSRPRPRSSEGCGERSPRSISGVAWACR